MGNSYRVLLGNMKRRDHLADLRVDGRIVLKFSLKECVRVWTELIWLRMWSSDGLL
jgi:hypothetical protein